MQPKTQIHAEDGRQELTIVREFDLPVQLLFKAHSDAELLTQWMGTNVLLLESCKHGSYRFETTDPKGNKHCFSGVIHEFIANRKITRTFEMEHTSFDAWLEFMDFASLDEERSKLTMHVVYKSQFIRDQILQMPFAQGINFAHNRIQELMTANRETYFI